MTFKPGKKLPLINEMKKALLVVRLVNHPIVLNINFLFIKTTYNKIER